MKASRKILNSVTVICLCSGSWSWEQQFQTVLVCCNSACSGSHPLLVCLLISSPIISSESQTITVQGAETRHLRQWCWHACSLTAGQKAGLLLLGRKQRVTGILQQIFQFCECVHVCTARVLTCFACYWCYSTCGCCLFSADVSTALFPLTTEYQFLPLSDLQLPPPITYASHFFSLKNNEFYWLFSLFPPTPSAPSLTSLTALGGRN